MIFPEENEALNNIYSSQWILTGCNTLNLKTEMHLRNFNTMSLKHDNCLRNLQPRQGGSKYKLPAKYSHKAKCYDILK